MFIFGSWFTGSSTRALSALLELFECRSQLLDMVHLLCQLCSCSCTGEVVWLLDRLQAKVADFGSTSRLFQAESLFSLWHLLLCSYYSRLAPGWSRHLRWNVNLRRQFRRGMQLIILVFFIVPANALASSCIRFTVANSRSLEWGAPGLVLSLFSWSRHCGMSRSATLTGSKCSRQLSPVLMFAAG